MSKKATKLISLLLSVIMLLGMVPMQVIAEGIDRSSSTVGYPTGDSDGLILEFSSAGALEVFRTVYGDTNFAFTAGDMRFICLNTNALEYDYSEPVPDFNFMTAQLDKMQQDSLTRCAFLMHAAPQSDVFNNNVAGVFQHYLHMFPGLQFCMHGHTHALTVTDIYNDGILYYQCPNIDKRIYLVFTINEEGYDYEAVEF